MRTRAAPGERPLYWMASAKKDLLVMPQSVVREIGLALGVAQHGGKHPAAKSWKGEGPGVLEIVSGFDGDTFRGVYTVAFRKAIYVLHCFQKKSPRGKKTAKPDVDLIGERLKSARIDYEERYGKDGK
jgi:phage-related protein